ncbi:MAG: hypothetical protein ACYTHM_24295, partial [Planctomycetota bacterium]
MGKFMTVRIVGSLLVLAMAGAGFADEITLKNGNVIDGKIIEETADKIVVETDFGKITIRRSQIKSIKRYRGPSAFDRKPEKREEDSAPPAGAIRVPGTGAYFSPLPSSWSRTAEGGEEGLVFREPGTKSTISVRVTERGDRKDSFMAFVHEHKKEGFPECRILWENPYVHSGRGGYEVAFESLRIPGLLGREYLLDLGEQTILVRLTGHHRTIKGCIPAYLALLQGLEIPYTHRSGKRMRSVPAVLETPHVTISYQPPVGPWRYQKRMEERLQLLSYTRQGECRIHVMIGFWDGHGKLVAKLLEVYFKRMQALSLGVFNMENERIH